MTIKDKLKHMNKDKLARELLESLNLTNVSKQYWGQHLDRLIEWHKDDQWY